MPKYVDPDARRREVVDALFRVAVRDGLQRASLRAVADEAGLNIGSLRHYFAGQQELMRFAMQSMLDRVGGRLLRRVEEIGGFAGHSHAEQFRLAAGLLGELLPLGEERRAEVIVFLDFSVAARTDPAFADLAEETATGTRRLVRRVLERLAETGALGTGRELGTETERLAALLDGLGLAAALHPQVLDPHQCAEALRTHLADLATPAPPDPSSQD
ncbi:TetR/AcrR family transcriptional regulator [Streptomyces sp. NPDC053427]|uniref:TetR/AcrR family transcriptional regulator n=1 Tax=Streptomyces sp. NPDC053427 TaxID=3365701 RepID=UPI0037D6BD00